jgi:hypothetical protein
MLLALSRGCHRAPHAECQLARSVRRSKIEALLEPPLVPSPPDRPLTAETRSLGGSFIANPVQIDR